MKPTRIYGNVKRLRVIRPFDPWNSPLCTCPPKYSLHPYTGCSHFCPYCYATAYIGQKPSMPKKYFLKNLKHDLLHINKRLVVEMSTSSDPYPPLEKWVLLTRLSLEFLKKHDIKVLITTKSDIVARDKDILASMKSAVMITITTIDDELAGKLEPGAPPTSKRLKAIRLLSEKGVPVGVRIDPIIPGLNDDPSMIADLVKSVKENGGLHIVTSTYKARPDNLKRMIEVFPNKKSIWKRLYLLEGVRMHGYIYLKKEIREKILEPVVSNAKKYGLTYATCREGLGPRFFNAPSCDGTHLISLKE